MNNHFIRTTSNGGYIGRWCWRNTGASGADGKDTGASGADGKDTGASGADGKDSCSPLPVTIIGACAGSIWIVRLLTR